MQDSSKPIWINENTYQTIKEVNTESKVKQTKNNLPKIFLATPVHSECSIHYAQSLLKFQQECLMRNILVSFSLLKSSLVTQGRNLCVNGMLEAGDMYTHLLFIDSDIEFKFETIMKMINADKDVIATPYPLKHVDWQKVHNRINQKGNMQPDLLSKQGYTWPIKLEGREELKVENGVAEVSHAPTGCMLIKKSVFDKMIKAYPEKKISQPTILNGQQIEKEYFYNFFDTYHEPDTKRYYGEDFGFCKRWTEIGGKCHVLVEDYITHVGEYRYEGRLMDDLTFKKD
jgi:hypothetical protein